MLQHDRKTVKSNMNKARIIGCDLYSVHANHVRQFAPCAVLCEASCGRRKMYSHTCLVRLKPHGAREDLRDFGGQGKDVTLLSR